METCWTGCEDLNHMLPVCHYLFSKFVFLPSEKTNTDYCQLLYEELFALTQVQYICASWPLAVVFAVC